MYKQKFNLEDEDSLIVLPAIIEDEEVSFEIIFTKNKLTHFL